MIPGIPLFFAVRRPPSGPGLIVVGASRSHTHTHTLTHTLRMTPLNEGSDRRRDICLTTLTTAIHAPREIRTRNANKRAAAEPRLRPHGECDRPLFAR
jgi:hypothetical protein